MDKVVKIKMAFLVDSVSVPGTAINNDLTLSTVKHSDIVMHYEGHNLLVRVKGKSVIIPGSNIRGMEIDLGNLAPKE